MKKRTRNIILAVVGLQIVLIIGLMMLPSVARAIPGRYRVALQERAPLLGSITETVIDQVAPMAAIPTPSQTNTERVDINALIASQPTAVPTEPPPPTATPVLSGVEVAVSAPETGESEAIPTTPPTTTPMPTFTPTPEPLPTAVSWLAWASSNKPSTTAARPISPRC
ncbi:MAG: hypothetical protein M5U34_41545 [Chloroflexi bacterium]|nr:hypothetical protein [Chloroflexota bacterium]